MPPKTSSNGMDQVQVQHPFPLQKLSFEILMKCLEKFTFIDWVAFRQCSSFSNEFSERISCRLVWKVGSIAANKERAVVRPEIAVAPGQKLRNVSWAMATEKPIRLESTCLQMMCYLTDEILDDLYNKFETNQVTCRKVDLRGYMECSAQKFVEFLEIISARVLEATLHVHPAIFDYSYAQNLSSINLATCPLTNEQFLSIKSPILELNGDTLSMEAMFQFAKEWKEGKRQLHLLRIRFDIVKTVKEEMLRDLDSNLIWSWAYHDQSLIREVPIDDLANIESTSFYSVLKSSDLEQRRLLIHNSNRFEMSILRDEVALFSEILPALQYSAIFRYR